MTYKYYTAYYYINNGNSYRYVHMPIGMTAGAGITDRHPPRTGELMIGMDQHHKMLLILRKPWIEKSSV